MTKLRMSSNEQLIDQARELHAKVMNCSDLASEGAWTAHETVNGLPPNNYWEVTAIRTPTTKGVAPFTVWKAHVKTPAMAVLLTFVSTGLPQLCDLADRAQTAEARIKELEALEGDWKYQFAPLDLTISMLTQSLCFLREQDTENAEAIEALDAVRDNLRHIDKQVMAAEARIKELEAERDDLVKWLDCDDRIALQAHITRLEEALRRIEAFDNRSGASLRDRAASEIARSALVAPRQPTTEEGT